MTTQTLVVLFGVVVISLGGLVLAGLALYALGRHWEHKVKYVIYREEDGQQLYRVMVEFDDPAEAAETIEFLQSIFGYDRQYGVYVK